MKLRIEITRVERYSRDMEVPDDLAERLLDNDETDKDVAFLELAICQGQHLYDSGAPELGAVDKLNDAGEVE